MSQMYRVEVPPRERAGSSQGLPGFVVMVEVSDHVISAFGNPGLADLQLKVVEIAKNATWKQRVKHWNLQFPSWLSSAVKDGNPADYGVADFTSGGRLQRMDNRIAARRKTRVSDCPLGVSLLSIRTGQFFTVRFTGLHRRNRSAHHFDSVGRYWRPRSIGKRCQNSGTPVPNSK